MTKTECGDQLFCWHHIALSPRLHYKSDMFLRFVQHSNGGFFPKQSVESPYHFYLRDRWPITHEIQKVSKHSARRLLCLWIVILCTSGIFRIKSNRTIALVFSNGFIIIRNWLCVVKKTSVNVEQDDLLVKWSCLLLGTGKQYSKYHSIMS